MPALVIKLIYQGANIVPYRLLLKCSMHYLISWPPVVVTVKIIGPHLVGLGQSTLTNAGHLQDLAPAAGRRLRVASDVRVALIAGVAGAEGSMPAPIYDAGGVVTALVNAAWV